MEEKKHLPSLKILECSLITLISTSFFTVSIISLIFKRSRYIKEIILTPAHNLLQHISRLKQKG